MCGIAGILNFDYSESPDPQILKRMGDSLVHRGPDGEGFFVKANVGLAHRRLAIIDLSTGDQPMYSEDRSLVTVFNGEIYNYLELKLELVQKGHRFKTTSDTEVILHAYAEWGLAFQSRLIGMWSFALWDDVQKKLIISRDRLGEKPLFFGQTRNVFVFGSEIKALFAFGFERTFASEITELYLFLGYLPAPYTFYKNIFKLKPGHFLVVDASGAREHKYWDLPDIAEKDMVRDDLPVFRKFEQLFQDALMMQIRSDVPLGIFLSGGLDSASILAGIAGFHSAPMNTITIGFQEAAFDERTLARKSAEAFGTNHNEFILERDTFSNSLAALIYHFDEPFADPAAIPVGYLSRLARQKVKVALSGDGGDEVLSGYNSYQSEKLAAMYGNCPQWIQRDVSRLFNLGGRLINGDSRHAFSRLQSVLSTSGLSFCQRLIQKFDPLGPDLIKKLAPTGVIGIEDYISDLLGKCPFEDPFYQLMWFHFKVFLPERMLPKVDRMSMAHGLEVRAPFLDYRIVELMYQTHKNVKMKGFTRKNVLRQTIGKKLPTSVLHARKKGFDVPLREWFRDDTYADMLHTLCIVDFGLNQRLIKTIVENNIAGTHDGGLLIWKLILYYQWNQNLK